MTLLITILTWLTAIYLGLGLVMFAATVYDGERHPTLRENVGFFFAVVFGWGLLLAGSRWLKW